MGTRSVISKCEASHEALSILGLTNFQHRTLILGKWSIDLKSSLMISKFQYSLQHELFHEYHMNASESINHHTILYNSHPILSTNIKYNNTYEKFRKQTSKQIKRTDCKEILFKRKHALSLGKNQSMPSHLYFIKLNTDNENYR